MRQLADTLEALFEAYWPYLLTAIVAVIIASMVDPITRNESHLWRMVLASLTLFFLAVGVLLRALEALPQGGQRFPTLGRHCLVFGRMCS